LGPLRGPLWSICVRLDRCLHLYRVPPSDTLPHMRHAIALGLIFAVAAVFVGAGSAARQTDAQLRAVVASGFGAVGDQIGSVLTCPECTEDAYALERISGAYMRRVNNTYTSTSRGSAARSHAFYAFRAYIVYGGDMALASLSADNPGDVEFYHRLASVALKVARAHARAAANLLGLSRYP
jgi:hypothetical protein